MAFTLPFTPSEITAFKDIALGLSALVTASAAVATAKFAFDGLTKWKSEARFQDRFQLAKAVVETAYKASEISSRLTAPVFLLHTTRLAERLPYEKMDPINICKEQLFSLHIQARALYGEEKSKPIEAYILALEDIHTACQIFLDNYNHIKEVNRGINSGEYSGDDELSQARNEIEAFSESLNNCKFFIIKRFGIKSQIMFSHFILEKDFARLTAKGDDVGLVYESEQDALDTLVKSMQSYLAD